GERRVERLGGAGGDVPVGRGGGAVAVGDRAGDGGAVFAPLEVGEDRVAAADVVEGEADVRGRRRLGDLLDQGHADRDLLAVGQEQGARDHLAGRVALAVPARPAASP